MDAGYKRARHLDLTADYLQRAVNRDITRLMIFEPPRHGKSKLTTEILPSWALGLSSAEQFMICSHTQSLAETFSRNVRNTIALNRYAKLFPNTRLSSDSSRVQQWTLDGYTRPAMMALGVGGSPTGQGASMVIIDDPIGDASDAESANARESLYQWYVSTIRPRLEPGGVIILMMQRWHDDDLAGRLLRDQARSGERWHVLNLMAIAEGDNDPLGRRPGEALWPERWPLYELEAIRSVSPRSFEAKYQQRPRPAEGSVFKRPWLRIEPAAPAGLSWSRFWDTAYSIKQTADNTATIAGALAADGVFYLRRGRAGRMETPDTRKLIKELALAEPKEAQGIEKTLHGGGIVQDLARDKELAKVSLKAVAVDRDKVARATPLADRAEIGKVVFVRESANDDGWIADWVDELCAFPFGIHDDRVDAASGAYAMSAGGKGWADFAQEQLDAARKAKESQTQ